MDQIAKILNISPLTSDVSDQLVDDESLVSVDSETNEFPALVEGNKEHDYNIVRNNLHRMINESLAIMPDALKLAKEAQNAKVWESTAVFMKMLADLNTQLLETSTKKNLVPSASVDKKKVNEEPSNQTNNFFFQGTSEEVFDRLSPRNSRKLLDITPDS